MIWSNNFAINDCVPMVHCLQDLKPCAHTHTLLNELVSEKGNNPVLGVRVCVGAHLPAFALMLACVYLDFMHALCAFQ